MASRKPAAGLAGQVGGHLQYDGPELVSIVHLLHIEHACGADAERGGGGAHPVAQRRLKTREQVDERVQAVPEAREALLARVHGLHRRAVLLQAPASQSGAALPGPRSEERAPSDEGRQGLKSAPEASGR